MSFRGYRRPTSFCADRFCFVTPIIGPNRRLTLRREPTVADLEQALAECQRRVRTPTRQVFGGSVQVMEPYGRTFISKTMAGAFDAEKGSSICVCLVNQLHEICPIYTEVYQIVDDWVGFSDFLWISWADVERELQLMNTIHNGTAEILWERKPWPWTGKSLSHRPSRRLS